MTNKSNKNSNNIEDIWNRIVANAGQKFVQIRGQVFTYEIDGISIIPSTTNQKIYKGEFAKAL